MTKLIAYCKSIALFVVLALLVGFAPSLPAAYAEEVTPAISGTTITIDSADDLVWVSAYSANTDESQKVQDIPFTFYGYTLQVTANIDMGNAAFTPITDFHGTLEGVELTEDVYPTISGLKVNTADNAALCGNIAYSGGRPVFRNLTIADSSFETSGNYAGSFAAQAYTSTFTNCHAVNVTVSANRFVGGIVGMTYGNITQCSLSGNSTVSASTRSLAYGDNVGGIVGLMGEGGMEISACNVTDAVLTGTRQVGGVAGLANYGNTITNCDVTNCQISALGSLSTSRGEVCAGGVVGQINLQANYTVTVTDNRVQDCTVTASALFGGAYSGWLIGEGYSRTSAGTLTTTGNEDLGGNTPDVMIGGTPSDNG